MKASFKPVPIEEDLHIPQEYADKTGLKAAEDIELFGNSGCLLLMDSGLTPMQMANAIDMFGIVTRNLLKRLETAGRAIESDCVQIIHKRDHVHILIPNKLLTEAGLPPQTDLDVEVSNGEIYISEAMDNEDKDNSLEFVPEYLKNILNDRGLDAGVLACLFECEEKFHE